MRKVVKRGTRQTRKSPRSVRYDPDLVWGWGCGPLPSLKTVFDQIDNTCRPDKEDDDDPEGFGMGLCKSPVEDISEYQKQQACIDEQADKTCRQKYRQALKLRHEEKKGDKADFKENGEHGKSLFEGVHNWALEGSEVIPLQAGEVEE